MIFVATRTLALLAVLAAASASGGLVPGGKSAKSDCYLALDIEGVPTGSAKKGKTVVCTDGDPCDTGACGDNACTVAIKGCVNQPGLGACQPPAGLKSAKIKGKLNVDVKQLLQGARCTPPVTDTIEAAKIKKNGKPKITPKNKLTLNGMAKALKGTKPSTDPDNWIIKCVKRTTDCPPPTTTTTTTLTTTTTPSTTTTTTLVCPNNGVKEGSEECDGSDFGGRTCPTGSLACKSDCTIDFTNCPEGCFVTPPTSFDFTNGLPVGNCGTAKDGTGAVLKNLSCGGLNIGGGNSTLLEGLTPDGSSNRWTVSCAGLTCTLTPNITTPAANSAATDCTDAGCNFGTPLPIANGPLSTCVLNTFATPSSGTVNCASGAATLDVNLSSEVFLTGNMTQPCPKCVVSGTPSPSTPLTGKCDGLYGTSTNTDCTTTNSAGLTRDCKPTALGSGGLGSIPVNLSPLRTGAATKTAANGLFCPGQGEGGINFGLAGCFGQPSCREITETGSPAGSLPLSTAKPVTLASVFCVPAVPNSVAINASAGLGGPGATALPGTFRFNP